MFYVTLANIYDAYTVTCTCAWTYRYADYPTGSSVAFLWFFGLNCYCILLSNHVKVKKRKQWTFHHPILFIWADLSHLERPNKENTTENTQMEVYIKTEDIVRGLQCFDPETNGLTPQQCHVRMRSLSVSLEPKFIFPSHPLTLYTTLTATTMVNNGPSACTHLMRFGTLWFSTLLSSNRTQVWPQTGSDNVTYW